MDRPNIEAYIKGEPSCTTGHEIAEYAVAIEKELGDALHAEGAHLAARDLAWQELNELRAALKEAVALAGICLWRGSEIDKSATAKKLSAMLKLTE